MFQNIWEWWCGPEDLVFRCLNFSHIDKYYWGARTSCKYTKLTQKYILLQRTLFSRCLQVIKVIQNRKRSLLFDCGSLTLLHRRVCTFNISWLKTISTHSFQVKRKSILMHSECILTFDCKVCFTWSQSRCCHTTYLNLILLLKTEPEQGSH